MKLNTISCGFLSVISADSNLGGFLATVTPFSTLTTPPALLFRSLLVLLGTAALLIF